MARFVNDAKLASAKVLPDQEPCRIQIRLPQCCHGQLQFPETCKVEVDIRAIRLLSQGLDCLYGHVTLVCEEE